MKVRVWFRPRILRNVSTVDYSTSILGYKTSMPVYITATALGKSWSLVPDFSDLVSRQIGSSRWRGLLDSRGGST
jgi:hypothetical protein